LRQIRDITDCCSDYQSLLREPLVVREINWSGPCKNQYVVLRGPPNYSKWSAHWKSLGTTGLLNHSLMGPFRQNVTLLWHFSDLGVMWHIFLISKKIILVFIILNDLVKGVYLNVFIYFHGRCFTSIASKIKLPLSHQAMINHNCIVLFVKMWSFCKDSFISYF